MKNLSSRKIYAGILVLIIAGILLLTLSGYTNPIFDSASKTIY